MNLGAGVANGTKGIVLRISPFRIDLKIITGPSKGENFSCPRFNHRVCRGTHTYNRLQFPMKLAYAVTVYKAQGMTLSRCAIDFSSHSTHHGAVYTALSRVRVPQDLRVIMPLDGFGPLSLVYEKFLDVIIQPPLGGFENLGTPAHTQTRYANTKAYVLYR